MTVGLVLVPQAIAYATLAGMPPQAGLYAAMLPAIVGILWGSSALLAVGPVALTSLLTFGSLSPLAVPGSGEWVALAIWLAIYAGAIQFLVGALRLGQIANLVSQPVVTGFINAAALIIIVSQLPDLLGMQPVAAALVAGQVSPLHALAPAGAALTAAFGCAALALLLGLKHVLPRFPGILCVAALGIAASWAFDYAAHGGAIIGTIPSRLPQLALPPAISFDLHRQLWPAALIVALISFTEAMSSCRELARTRRERWDENQEMIGQGLAKLVSGLSGAFPVSGSFSRSALNLYAGAVSGWSTLFAAACVLLSLMYLTDVIYFLPKSVLAAMIMVPVFGLVDIGAMRRLFAMSPDDGWVAAVTFAITLCSMPRLHWGVFAGIGLTMTIFLYRRMQPRIIEVGRHQDGTLRDRGRFGMAALAPDLLAVRMDAALNFLTAASLERFVSTRCDAQGRHRRVLLCAGGINSIDASGIDTLAALHAALRADGVALYLCAVKKQVWDVLDKAGLIAAFGAPQLFATDLEAIAALAPATVDAASQSATLSNGR